MPRPSSPTRSAITSSDDGLLDVCAALDDAVPATTVPGAYGSILDTLRHIVGGDVYNIELDRRQPGFASRST